MPLQTSSRLGRGEIVQEEYAADRWAGKPSTRSRPGASPRVPDRDNPKEMKVSSTTSLSRHSG
jgi:hypothetical protein